MEESLEQQNQEVDDLCGCPGKTKTRSRRVLKIHHEEWCFYYMHCTEKTRTLLDDDC